MSGSVCYICTAIYQASVVLLHAIPTPLCISQCSNLLNIGKQAGKDVPHTGFMSFTLHIAKILCAITATDYFRLL